MTSTQIFKYMTLSFLAVALAYNAAHGATYQLINYPVEQQGHTLAGSIVTLDSAPDDGLLDAAEIVDWSFTVQGPKSFSASKSDPGSATIVSGMVGISDTSITIASPFADGQLLMNDLRLEVGDERLRYFRFTNFAFQPFEVVDFYDAQNAINSTAWQSSSSVLGGNDPWVIAEVPEPSSASIALALLFLPCMYRRPSTARGGQEWLARGSA